MCKLGPGFKSPENTFKIFILSDTKARNNSYLFSNMLQTKSIFEERLEKFKTEENYYQKKYNQWALLRGLIFIGGVALCYLVNHYYSFEYTILSFAASIAFFFFSINKHLRIKALRDKFRNLAELNKDELSRLNGIFLRQETGEEFAVKNHFYAFDIDLFGKHSLFKLVNRTRTYAGAKLLADWLQNPSDYQEILSRQNAVSELKPLVDWRQDFEVSATLSQETHEPVDRLLEWVMKPENEKIHSEKFRLLRYLPILTLLLLAAWISGFLKIGFFLVFLAIHGLILRQIIHAVSQAIEDTNRISGTLRAYADLLEQIAGQAYQNEKLKSLQNKILNASPEVFKLEDIIRKLGNRTNPFFALVAGVPLLWDLQYFIKLEDWRKKNRNFLKTWLDVVSEFEALNSYAGLAFANADFIAPSLNDNALNLNVKKMGHPLIHFEKRITNDISLNGIGKTIIITGSNMSGKSTFLRTLGINISLALSGAVVCASAFNCSVFQLFTSMRTQDSLEESTSSFYAELKRLQQLIGLVSTPKSDESLPVLYFLDEILKGTNSKDRHSGAKALIFQLHQTNSSGFISTHDVELGDELEGSDFIENLSFSSEVINNQLIFDYTLRKGVCHSFNASQLMKQIGIRIA